MSDIQNYIPWITIITDLANGTVNIDNWINPQRAIRPINELTILQRQNIDPNADYDVIYDASTWNHVRVLSTRASQTNYLADWVNDTRTGSLWTINSSIYAVWNHIHPIIKLSPFATAPTITFAWFTTPTGTANLTYLRSTEETITYVYQGSLTIPNTIGWRNFTISNVAWYTMKSTVMNLYRLTAMTGYPWTNTMESWQCSNNFWWSSTTYLYNGSTLPWAVINISSFRVEVEYTLN